MACAGCHASTSAWHHLSCGALEASASSRFLTYAASVASSVVETGSSTNEASLAVESASEHWLISSNSNSMLEQSSTTVLSSRS